MLILAKLDYASVACQSHVGSGVPLSRSAVGSRSTVGSSAVARPALQFNNQWDEHELPRDRSYRAEMPAVIAARGSLVATKRVPKPAKPLAAFARRSDHGGVNGPANAHNAAAKGDALRWAHPVAPKGKAGSPGSHLDIRSETQPIPPMGRDAHQHGVLDHHENGIAASDVHRTPTNLDLGVSTRFDYKVNGDCINGEQRTSTSSASGSAPKLKVATVCCGIRRPPRDLAVVALAARAPAVMSLTQALSALHWEAGSLQWAGGVCCGRSRFLLRPTEQRLLRRYGPSSEVGTTDWRSSGEWADPVIHG